MPEFHLDTSGKAYKSVSPTTMEAVRWADLDGFTAGYVEALFFTENEPSLSRYDDGFRAAYPQEDDDVLDDEKSEDEYFNRVREGQIKEVPGDYGFADLAPDALARIIIDCRVFQLETLDPITTAFAREQEKLGEDERADDLPDDTQAGRDFWYTRNGHGCGFWDGDWPEPYATQLTDAARAFGEIDVYLGDDGKVWSQ